MDYLAEWNVFTLKKGSKYPPPNDFQKTKFKREGLKEHKGNFGLGCGDISGGLVVFDWDFRKGFNRKTEGFKTIFKEYKEKLGRLANTCIVETPNGFHLYYKLKGIKYRNTGQKNGGFSKTLKTFQHDNSVRFGQYLQGLDTRANGGYVVCPPSRVKDGKYSWLIEREPLEITDLDYLKIMDFFEVKEKDKAANTIRSKFIDIIMGKLEPPKLVTKDHPEHVFWKEMYHEAWRCCGLRPFDLIPGLIKYQKTFDQEETDKQLANQKNLDYIYSISRLSKEKYEDYFEINKVDIKDLFGLVDDNNTGVEGIELVGRGTIVEREDGLFLVKQFKDHSKEFHVLEGKLKLEKLAYETLNNNRLLVSGIHENKEFRTIPMDVLLLTMSDYIYQGNTGKDVVKKYIHHLKDDLEVYKLNYVLGFNSHWSLPCLEEEKKFQIITSTDKQIEAYKKCKDLPKAYKPWEKKTIKKLLKRFINITQMKLSKLAIIIGWAMAAPFRSVFIEILDLFAILCAYGPRNTGKSAILKFFCLDFYGLHQPYNSSVLYSTSRFEDIMSTGSFPIFVEEIIVVPMDILSLIKEHGTMTSRFFRKKNARENDFDCLKSAPLVFDCNKAVKSLMDPATNSKLTLIPFNNKEKIALDIQWVNLRKLLRGYNLFSLVYDYTKDWSKETVGLRINKYLKERVITEEDEENNPRLLQQWVTIRFGLDLFEEVFDIKLDKEEFLDVLRFGRTRMTQSLLVDFYSFCKEAIDYDEGDLDDNGRKTRGDNPNYLNHPLGEYKSKNKGNGYFFDALNKADFQNFTKDKHTLEDIVEKITDALQDRHKKLVSAHNTGKKRGIFINEEFFDLSIFKESKKLPTEADIKDEYGDIPE